MRSLAHSVTALFALTVACSNVPYRVHYNDSYFPEEQRLSMYGSSLIATAVPDTVLEITGVYCSKKAFLEKYPVIRTYYRDRGRTFIPLLSALSCPDGSLITARGVVTKKAHTYPRIRKTNYYHFLNVDSYAEIDATTQLKEVVNAAYAAQKNRIKAKITPDKSKLDFPAFPEWDIWYDLDRGKFIFFTHFYDLMYAAVLEIIVDAGTRNIIDIYAREWFKGEL